MCIRDRGLIDRAAAEAVDEAAPEPRRLQDVELLACAPEGRSREVLAGLLDPRQPRALQVAALHALGTYSDPGISKEIIEHYRGLAPAVRSEAVETLLSRPAWTLALLSAAGRGEVEPSQIELSRRAMLVGHKKKEIAALARSVFGKAAAPTSPAGKDVLASFAPALKLAGDTRRGSEVFGRLCATCHRIGDKGHAVGPDLTATQFRDPDALLTHVLEPNRYVQPNHVQYVVGDRNGRVFTGLIASETASSITLRRAEGAEDTILRSQIEEMAGTGKSLMPEDFATKLNHQEMADLLAYILSTHRGAPDSDRLDIGTIPGSVEPEK
jgi:putative heme-binding domain-containing protein